MWATVVFMQMEGESRQQQIEGSMGGEKVETGYKHKRFDQEGEKDIGQKSTVVIIFIITFVQRCEYKD